MAEKRISHRKFALITYFYFFMKKYRIIYLNIRYIFIYGISNNFAINYTLNETIIQFVQGNHLDSCYYTPLDACNALS